jgi:hypothetical protein
LSLSEKYTSYPLRDFACDALCQKREGKVHGTTLTIFYDPDL